MKASHNIFHAAGFGKVAPWVDLANSEEWDGFGNLTDHLANPRWRATFLKHSNLHPLPSKGVTSRKLVQLRVLLRRAAETLAARDSRDIRDVTKNCPGGRADGRNVKMEVGNFARAGGAKHSPGVCFL